MRQEESSLVAKITLTNNTYYVTDRDDVNLDGTDYDNVVISWGQAKHYGNLGNGESQISNFDMVINNGEQFQGSGYKFPPTNIWNNGVVEVRRWTKNSTFLFTQCLPHIKGILKKYKIANEQVSFSVESEDKKDFRLIPGVRGIDQTSLTDGDAKTTFKPVSGYDNRIEVTTDLFNIGELLRLSTPVAGVFEYGRVRSKPSTKILEFYDDLQNTYIAAAFLNNVEKAFRNIPKAFIDKTVPIQIGTLTDTTNGVFGKLFTIDDAIGSQVILADYYTMNAFNNLGAWESGLKRYFVANDVSVTVKGNQPEYRISNNMAIFIVDTATTITHDIIDTVEGTSVLNVADYTKLMWVNEDDLGTGSAKVQELISVNVIAIDSELMLLMSEPDSSQIYVERGYNNTTITTHDAGAAIYQTAKYSGKNIILFTERFMATEVTNITKSHQTTGTVTEEDTNGNPVTHFTQLYVVDSGTGAGKLSNIVNESTGNYVETYVKLLLGKVISLNADNYFLIFDVKFPEIQSDFFTIGWYPATKYELDVDLNINLHDVRQAYIAWGMINPNLASNVDFTNLNENLFDTTTWQRLNFGYANRFNAGTDTLDNDFYTAIDRTYEGTWGGAFSNWTLNYDSIEDRSNILLTSLKDLNKKWKMFVWNHLSGNGDDDGAIAVLQSKLYNIGFWIDFAIDFTRQPVLSSLLGRELTTATRDVVGTLSPDVRGDLAENPVDVLALLLTEEMGYDSDDFSSNWDTVRAYYEEMSNFIIEVPKVAFSYGIEDEQMTGWKFCSWLASHFNLQIVKKYDGSLDIVNLHETYISTPTGNEIKIEDISFIADSGNRQFQLHQTGTDLIYNDIQVKWKRNNSTDEYQEVYVLPDTYTIEKSGVTLATARTNYYGGEKRSLIIESPFIYQEIDARRLAEWKANDQAEVHFFVDFIIDYSHYTDVNSLSNQYQVGDIIYLTGTAEGITFASTAKFYIQNVFFVDSGRQIQIQAKSVNPVPYFAN